MSEEQRRFLALLPHITGRLSIEKVAWLTNFQVHDIPFLVSAGLLKPLGNPPRTGVKYFSAARVLELSRDDQWLAKATNVVYRAWKTKNMNRKMKEEAVDNDCVD